MNFEKLNNYTTNKDTNTDWAERVDCYLDYYDASTGKYLGTIALGNVIDDYWNTAKYNPSHHFCNGIF